MDLQTQNSHSSKLTHFAFSTEKKKDLLEATNKHGETPLYLAALVGNTSIATIFLAKEAPVNSKTNSGESVLHASVIANSPAMFKLLEQAQGDKAYKHPTLGTAETLAAAMGDFKFLTAVSLGEIVIVLSVSNHVL